MGYPELPDEIAAIHDLPGDFPELTTVQYMKLKAFLRTSKLHFSMSETQQARKAGRPAEYDLAVRRRERLKRILDFNEKRCESAATDIERKAADSDESPRQPAEPDDQAFLGPRDLAKLSGVDHDALRKRLERFRQTHCDGWNPVTEPRPREPRYLYQVAAVKHIIDDMIASGQVSSERPAKKNPPR